MTFRVIISKIKFSKFMYHPENLKIGGNIANSINSLNTPGIDQTLTENNKHLARAFESQCKEDFDDAFENLQAVWNNLSFLIEHADQQPNTHSVIRDYREILSRQMFEDCFSRTDLNLNSHTFSKNVVEGILNSNLAKNEKQKQKKHLWSDEEHQKFVEAIDKYKRDFKKVAEYIETRSVKQVRSHYQKYMMKINKQSGAGTGGSDKKEPNEANSDKTQEKINDDKENQPGGNIKQEIKEANVE